MFTDTETMVFTDTKEMTRHLPMTGEKTRCLQTPTQWCLPTPKEETHAGADLTLTGITRTTS